MQGHRLFACIEAGGTKVIVAVIDGETRAVVDSARFPTTMPNETITAVIGWLEVAIARHGAVAGAGIASFGPIELDRQAPNWGHITRTTKPGWSDIDLAGPIGDALGVPTGFDTDVNGAALAEAKWGASQGHAISVYLTVGTGIGGGTIVDGRPLRGLTHPEMGHIRIERHLDDRNFAGACPFHGDCIEGLAAGPAIIARWGASLSELGSDHPGNAIIAFYLAQLCVTLQALLEPGRIVLGGGVMATTGLLKRVRDQAGILGGGYFRGVPEDIIVAPALGDQAGILGAFALALDAL